MIPDRAPAARVSAALVDRDDALAQVARRWDEARDGSGQFVLVSGEAGIGKSRLLDEALGLLDGAPSLTTRAWPRDAEFPGAVLYDLARELRQRGQRDAGTALQERLTRQDTAGDDARRHRLLVGDLADQLISLLAEHPLLLRIEDLHWADELSLDVLERAAPMIRRTSSLVLGTYRSDEVRPGSALAAFLAGLFRERFAEEVALDRLDRDGTLRLAESLLGEVPPAELIDTVHERSNGIPLYIEELIAACDTDAVPSTVAEAVRVRTARLDDAVTGIVVAAAAIGCSFEFDLLADIVAEPEDEIDRALRVLVDEHLMVALSPTKFDFRHALIRDALYEAVPPFRRRNLHASVARASEAAGIRRSYLSEQYELANLPDQAHPHALQSAIEAADLSAHREAVELFARALRTAPADASLEQLAELNRRFGVELAVADRNAEAAERLQVAVDQFRAIGDVTQAAGVTARLMFVRHQLGDGLDQRLAMAHEALAWLDAEPDGGSDDARAAVLGEIAASYLLSDRLDDALEFGRRAEAIAPHGETRFSDRLDIQSTIGTSLVFSGDSEGWRILERVIAQAEGREFEYAAVRARRMLGSSASALVDYPRAATWLDEGLRYTAAIQRWNDHNYLRAHRAHVRWATGTAGAERDARRALADGGGITTEIEAQLVLGYLHLQRAEFADAADRLARALELAEPMRELQRISPAVWGMAELAYREGRMRDAIALCERGLRLSEEVADAAYLFPYLVTATRAHLAERETRAARTFTDRCAALLLRRSIPGTLPALDHARGLIALAEGRSGEARELLTRAGEEWDALDRFWEGTQALLDLARCASRGRRVGEATRYAGEARRRAADAGAVLLVDAADDIKLDPTADAATGPLTAREFEVARLVAEGATNREIAERLVISPKTASAHIEHILAKLGVNRRAEIAAWVSRS
jgi:DNA-binding CsgD family transcriptional regulator